MTALPNQPQPEIVKYKTIQVYFFDSMAAKSIGLAILTRETCGRHVIEAVGVGCKMSTNDSFIFTRIRKNTRFDSNESNKQAITSSGLASSAVAGCRRIVVATMSSERSTFSMGFTFLATTHSINVVSMQCVLARTTCSSAPSRKVMEPDLQSASRRSKASFFALSLAAVNMLCVLGLERSPSCRVKDQQESVSSFWGSWRKDVGEKRGTEEGRTKVGEGQNGERTGTIHDNAMQCNTILYNAMQCNAVLCNTIP